MSGKTTQQGYAAKNSGGSAAGSAIISNRRAPSKSKILGIGVVGTLFTAAAIAGVVMMPGSPSTPVNTQVAAVSAPAAAVAQAPATATTPVTPAYAPAPLVAPAPPSAPNVPVELDKMLSGFLARQNPNPAAVTEPTASDQCAVAGGQRQELAVAVYAKNANEIGQLVRIHAGSYVSSPVSLTRAAQIVRFPTPPGSPMGSARILLETATLAGSTFADVEGITGEIERRINGRWTSIVLHWPMPRC
jgi:hypothetical protein